MSFLCENIEKIINDFETETESIGLIHVYLSEFETIKTNVADLIRRISDFKNQRIPYKIKISGSEEILSKGLYDNTLGVVSALFYKKLGFNKRRKTLKKVKGFTRNERKKVILNLKKFKNLFKKQIQYVIAEYKPFVDNEIEFDSIIVQ